MILTCPDCASRYLLSAQALAPDGRQVKCSSCGHQWFETPDEDELANRTSDDVSDIDDIGDEIDFADLVEENMNNDEGDEIEDIPESVKPLPEDPLNASLLGSEEDEDEGASTDKQGGIVSIILGLALALIVGALILVALIVLKPAITNAWQPAAGLYQMLGMPVSAPGEGLVFDRVTAKINEDDAIVVDAQIINLQSEEIYLPSIEVSVRDVAGNIIKETLVHPPFDMMKPESTLPFQSTYIGNTADADHVQLRFVLKGRDAQESAPQTAPVEAAEPAEEHQDEAAHDEAEEQHYEEESHGDAHDQ